MPYEDMRLVQNNMLVGVAPELIGDTPSEMMAISTGRGENFVVQGVVRRGRGHVGYPRHCTYVMYFKISQLFIVCPL